MKHNIENLLNQIYLINKKYEEIDKITGKNFNILEAGNIAHKELFHTQLMSELLNPKGSHNQGDTFLKLFLEQLSIKSKLNNPKVYAEYVIDNNRRIDIYIEDTNFTMAIEAKIYAEDRDNQLKDYFEFIKNKNNPYLVYLTLDGHEPSKNSLTDINTNDILQISFEHEIYNWINECIKHVVDIPILREGLNQYKLLLEKITNKNIKKLKNNPFGFKKSLIATKIGLVAA